MTPTTLDHALIAALAAATLYATLRGQPQMKAAAFDAAMRRSVYWTNAIILWLAGGVTVLVWRLGDRSYGDLGLTMEHTTPLLGVGLAVVFVAMLAALTIRDFRDPVRRAKSLDRIRRCAPFMPRTRTDLGHFCVLALAAGTAEEVIARGFLIRYIEGLGADLASPAAVTAVAVLAPALAFTLAHRYQPPAMLLRVFVLAAIFGAIFVATGSLLIPMLMHVAVDVFAGILLVRLDGEVAAPEDAPDAPPEDGAVATVERLG